MYVRLDTSEVVDDATYTTIYAMLKVLWRCKVIDSRQVLDIAQNFSLIFRP